MVLEERVRLLRLLGERLRLLQAQDALLLLRHLFPIPKVFHALQSSPCFTSTHLCDCDDLLRDILRDIINVTLEPGPAWLQASLPVHAGGFGIRSAAQLAPSAYLASAAGCTNLVQQIFPTLHPPQLQDSTNPCIDCALTIWSQGHNQAPPTPPASHQISTDQMANVQMEHPLSPGRVVECWSGTSQALTPWRRPMQHLQRGKLRQ